MSKLREIVTSDIFGAPLSRQGEVYARRLHGFENAGGSWSCSGGEGWQPCRQVAIRWKGKRKIVWTYMNRIVSGVEDYEQLPEGK